MKTIKVTHANTKNEAFIFIKKIFSYGYSDGYKCCVIWSDAGAVFPVIENIDELHRLLNNEQLKNDGE